MFGDKVREGACGREINKSDNKKSNEPKREEIPNRERERATPYIPKPSNQVHD